MKCYRFTQRLAVCTLGIMSALSAQATNLETAYTFLGGTDGWDSGAPLVEVDGLFYGTTSFGATTGYGTVFEFNPVTRIETVLHSFNGGGDGAYPIAGLTFYEGNFYGTTTAGGSSDAGTVFKINPVTGDETVLYSFADGTDGRGPYGGLIYYNGSFYGDTEYGGITEKGVIFKIDAVTSAETVIYRFGGEPDGIQPMGNLAYYSGKLYGITEYGGSAGLGIVFAIDLSTGAETVLHSFAGGNDGAYPEGRLIEHDGNLYGTTDTGGTADVGTVFRIDPTTGGETVLYSFAGEPDAGYPYAGVTFFGGKLYGNTTSGGLTNWGAVFSLDLASGKEKVLGSFVQPDSGALVGAQPTGELFYYKGEFYGTTTIGGDGAGGTIFRVNID
jgi:uncharacterized repeat protein (TIGR03803 family)